MMDTRYLIATFLISVSVPVNADFGISASAIAAASAAISAGTSLVGTTLNGLMDNGYRVTCGIEVENWSRFPLTDATVRINGGAVSVPPLAVLPGKREVMVARKTSDTATGSYGTVSWLIESNPPRRVVIMWCAPYDFNFHSNWLAVGLTTPRTTIHASGNQWFDEMYYYSNTHTLRFQRKEYRWSTSPARIMDDRFMVVGTMGTGHKARVKIIFRPRSEADLAPQIRALLGNV